MFQTRTETKPELLFAHFHWRTRLLRACAQFDLSKTETAVSMFNEVATLLTAAKAGLAPEESAALELVRELCMSLEQVCRWVEAKKAGAADADRFVEAARTRAMISKESVPKLRYVTLR